MEYRIDPERCLKLLCLSFGQISTNVSLIQRSASWRIALFVVSAYSRLIYSGSFGTVMNNIDRSFSEYRDILNSHATLDDTCSNLLILSDRLSKQFDKLFSSRIWFINKLLSSFHSFGKPKSRTSVLESEIKNALSISVSVAQSKVSLLDPSRNQPRPFDKLPLFRTQEPLLRADRRYITRKARLVSVVVPLYNKQNHVVECLRSISTDRHSNIEIIVIDDNSTDRSFELASAEAAKDPRIAIRRLSANNGAGFARNVGLRLARGEYVMFADADDLINHNAIHDLVAIAESTMADIVRGKITGLSKDGSRRKLASEHLLHNYDAETVSWQNTESLWFYWYFTANLYRRDFLQENAIFFPQKIRNEDPFFLCRSFLSTRKISLYNNTVYRYRVDHDAAGKVHRTPFLTGWAMGYYYLYQLIQSQTLPAQYFLIHFQGLIRNSIHLARAMDREIAIHYLSYIATMFRDARFELFTNPELQPWQSKRNFHSSYIEIVETLKFRSIDESFDLVSSLARKNLNVE